MSDWAVTIFLWIGAVLTLLSAVGIVRMPDLFLRMQAATKAGTLGIVCIILAVAIDSGDSGVMIRAFLVVLFLFFTAPVAAHAIARAAYCTKVPLWERTVRDDLAERAQNAGTKREHGDETG